MLLTRLTTLAAMEASATGGAVVGGDPATDSNGLASWSTREAITTVDGRPGARLGPVHAPSGRWSDRRVDKSPSAPEAG